MRCMICGSELNGCLCPRCGFDLSQCREQSPTLADDGRQPEAIWVGLNRRFEEPQASTPAPQPVPVSTPVPGPKKKKKLWLIPLVAALLALGVFIGVSSGGKNQPTVTTPAPQQNTVEAQTPATRASSTSASTAKPDYSADLRVALIMDYGDITDGSYNQAVYEGAMEWCEENNRGRMTCFKLAGDSTADRVDAIESAIEEGYDVLLLPGWSFAGAIVETVEIYPDVKFIALDVSEWDLQDARGTYVDFSWKYPANLYSAVYQEELAGYMAGVAAVKLGYTKIGFLGAMAVPEVVRYGYGFVQGVNDAAKELGNVADIELKYVYGNQFFGDADILDYMDTWYAAGTEVVFACGGGIYTSAADAAKKVGGKVIGVDVDQAPTINDGWGKDMTVTSAMKGLGATAKAQLGKIADGSFRGGIVEALGIVSENPEENFVQLAPSTQWAEGKFTENDYRALVSDLLYGRINVSDATDVPPDVDIFVDYQGNIK